jgi:hypothetical protein
MRFEIGRGIDEMGEADGVGFRKTVEGKGADG